MRTTAWSEPLAQSLTEILRSPVQRSIAVSFRDMPRELPLPKEYSEMWDAAYDSLSSFDAFGHPRGFMPDFCTDLVESRRSVLSFLGTKNSLVRKDGDGAIAARVLGLLVGTKLVKRRRETHTKMTDPRERFRIASKCSDFEQFKLSDHSIVVRMIASGKTTFVGTGEDTRAEDVALFAPLYYIYAFRNARVRTILPFAAPFFGLETDGVGVDVMSVLPRLTSLVLRRSSVNVDAVLHGLPAAKRLRTFEYFSPDAGVWRAETYGAVTEILRSPIPRAIAITLRDYDVDPAAAAMYEAAYDSVSHLTTRSYPVDFRHGFCTRLVNARRVILPFLGSTNALVRKDGDHAIMWRVLGFLVDDDQGQVRCAKKRL